MGRIATRHGTRFGSRPRSSIAPAQLAEEMRAAGLNDVRVVGVEGPAWLWGDRGREPDDDEWRSAALWAARTVEDDEDFKPMSAHFLAVGYR